MTLEQYRIDCAERLQRNDRNGAFTDSVRAGEGIAPMTIRDIASQLAISFIQQLEEDIGAEKLREAARLNATPAYAGCCATGDYCDSNMSMASAFERHGIATSVDIDGETNPEDRDHATMLWNMAWDIAHAADFLIERV